jgi:ATP synthase protein I
MTRIQPEDFDDADDAFEPLTAEQVRELRKHQPLLSVWRVVMAQVLVGLLVASVVWWVSGRMSAVYSAAYGALAVILPAALFVRGLTSPVASVNAGAAVFGFFGFHAEEVGRIAASDEFCFAATAVGDRRMCNAGI